MRSTACIRLALALTLATIATTGTAATTRAAARPAATVASYTYADDDSTGQSISATYDPDKVGQPWVVTLHGGAWAEGNPSQVQDAVNVLSAAGYAVFNVGYRLTSDVAWPQQWQDIQDAWAWIRSHATQFGIDPHRGAVYGFSAGGQLAAMMGNRIPSVRAVVSVSGVLQPYRIAWDVEGISGDAPRAHELPIYGWESVALRCPHSPSNPACNAAWHSFYPSSYLTSSSAPTIAFQGSADETIPPVTASSYGATLAAAGVPHQVVIANGVYHYEVAALDDGPRQAQMLAWLTQYDS